MKKMKNLIIFLFLFSCKGNTVAPVFEDGKAKFISVNKIPVIEGKLNGKKAFFVIDTGASISVLDEKQGKEYGFESSALDENTNLSGYGGNTYMKEAIYENVMVGGVDFNGEYYSQDLSNIVRAIRENEGIKISGIIGCNILKSKKAVIDLEENTIHLKR